MSTLPVLFIGHGSPMNAIADNAYTRTLQALGQSLPRPRAVLCISAHWMTEGTWVTGMQHPRTIHDFYGFPQPLFDVQYPAPGAPEIAQQIQKAVGTPKIHADVEMWGLDHGTWSVMRHLFPQADVPVLQLSLYMAKPNEYHFELGQRLSALRDDGILIVGSGNVVHNLRRLRWEENAQPFDWAIEFDEWMKQKIQARDFSPLVHDAQTSSSGQLSVPTLDHYLPLLYVLGAARPEDRLKFEYEEIQNGSISMRSLSFG